MRTFLLRSAHYSGKKSAPMQVEESIMCQAELAEVCLGHRNGIISGILWERKPKKIQEWDIRLHTPRARSVSFFKVPGF